MEDGRNQFALCACKIYKLLKLRAYSLEDGAKEASASRSSGKAWRISQALYALNKQFDAILQISTFENNSLCVGKPKESRPV